MRARALVAAATLLLAAAASALAAEWGLIQPGVSTTQTVRGQYGAPTRMTREKIENYDTEKWIYEGEQAPAGIVRLSVDFGLLRDNKYRADLVRAFELEPHGSTFNRGIVSNGWGVPDRVGHQGDADVFLYKDGLLVYFTPDGWNVRLMVFTLPQPRDPTEERR
ncbi:MAG TPA: hypothetical protein VFL90_07000 [Methylomirabilota bacterium]|nr:hypothetical protein [Methylomirabilota bacterium]